MLLDVYRLCHHSNKKCGTKLDTRNEWHTPKIVVLRWKKPTNKFEKKKRENKVEKTNQKKNRKDSSLNDLNAVCMCVDACLSTRYALEMGAYTCFY